MKTINVSSELISKKLFKSHNHDHYWIEDGHLFESYMTLRGLRYRELMQVSGMPDCDKCTEAMIVYIEKEYLP